MCNWALLLVHLAACQKEAVTGKVRRLARCSISQTEAFAGFSPDPVLSGIAVSETIRGIQAAGVIACTKHFILNEQEHYRQPGGGLEAASSNIDDSTMHELYLW